MSAVLLASACSVAACEPVHCTDEKNRPSRACGATAWRSAFMPLCESALLQAARRPRHAGRVVAPRCHAFAETTSALR